MTYPRRLLFTLVPGRNVLGTSPVSDSRKSSQREDARDADPATLLPRPPYYDGYLQRRERRRRQEVLAFGKDTSRRPLKESSYIRRSNDTTHPGYRRHR